MNKKKCLTWVLLMTLVLGVLSPMADVQAKVIKTNAWTHISSAEQELNTMSYDQETDTFNFPQLDNGWSARMVNMEWDLSGKNYVVEFDTALVGGGVLFISPCFEDAANYAGIGLHGNGGLMEQIIWKDGNLVDDFSYAAGFPTGSYQYPTQGSIKSALESGTIRIAFCQGPNGGMAGGTATVYHKAVGSASFINMGTWTFSTNITETAAANRLYIQLRAGTGSISNLKITELESGWNYASSAEQALGRATYDAGADALTFAIEGPFNYPTDTQHWAARMIKTDQVLSPDKDWLVEFDTALVGGGELLVSTNYEDSTHFAGLGLHGNGGIMEQIIWNDTLVDDFSYAGGYPAGSYQYPTQGAVATALTSGTIRIAFRRGANGGLAGGTATLYHKAVGATVFTNMGTWTFGTNIAETDAPNYLYFQLREGYGNISNIKVTELEDTWNYVDTTRLSEAAQCVTYDAGNGVITFPTLTGDVIGRMYQTELDLSGKDWAVEFDANGVAGELLISPNYENAGRFAGVGLDLGLTGQQLLEGVIVEGGFVDTFHWAHITTYSDSDPYTAVSGMSGTAHFRIEFRNGADGTLAGGTAIVYQKASGADTYTELGKYTFGNNITDTELPNRLYIQNWHGGANGSISNIQVTELEPYSDVEGDSNSDSELTLRDLIHLKKLMGNGYNGNNQSDLNDNGVLDTTDAKRMRLLLLDVIAGATAPSKESDGGYALQAGNYRFQLYDTGNGYGTKVLNASGTTVMEQTAPIVLQIKKSDGSTELVNGYYSTLNCCDNTVVAAATVTSTAGSKFHITDQYVVCDDQEGFAMDRDIKVLEAGSGDEGFNSFVKFKEKDAKTSGNYEYFIPAQIVKDSAQLPETSPCYNMGQSHVWIRESQMGLPMVMTRNSSSGNTFAISRIMSESYSGIIEADANWVVNKNIQYASLGISNTEGYVSMDLCYPGIEGDRNYQSGDTTLYRSHPIQTDVEHTYRVALMAGNYTNFSDAMVATYENAFARMPIPEVDVNLSEVYDETVDLLDEYTKNYSLSSTTESAYAMGMPRELGLDGQVDTSDTNYDMGFTGQQTSVGAQLIRNGYLTGSQERLDKGRTIINFWMRSFTSYGFPIISYNTQTGQWGANGNACYIRHMTDGMEGVLDAYQYEQDATTRSTWLEKCVSFANWLVNKQNSDGSYALSYDQRNGNALDSSKNNTACAVRYLVRMYQQTGTQAYLTAAQKAAQYVYDNEYVLGKYYGGAFDAGAYVDRESAIFALYAFNAMYEVTSNAEWLKASKDAAVQAASFVYTFDFNVWGGDTYNIYRDCVGTSGLSIISTYGCNVDTFAAYAYYDFFRLYQWTGDEVYYDIARLLQNNARQFVNVDGNLSYGADGLICEAQNISRYYYAGSVETYLPWSSIGMINPIGMMEKTFGAGVSKVELAKKTLN